MDTQLQLPRQTRHNRSIVDRCEWRIRWFVEHDAYVMYDYWITTRDVPPDVVTRDHLLAINNAMRARARVEPWEPLFGQSLPELNAITPDLDLIGSPARCVEDGLSALRSLCARITSIPFITDMAFSKVFHLLRPRFVPISDSYVRLCLGVRDVEPAGADERGGLYATRLERVVRAVRDFGRVNAKALEQLEVFADRLPPVVPQSGPFRGRNIPVKLSRVRLLDILLWTEVAIYGENPHPLWLSAHRAAFGEPVDGWQAPAPPGAHASPPRQRDLLEVRGVAVFKDNDSGYVDWLRTHSNGLVLNCERSPRASYLVLHRATCWTITGKPARGRTWTGPYLKACATSKTALTEWAALATCGAPKACKICSG